MTSVPIALAGFANLGDSMKGRFLLALLGARWREEHFTGVGFPRVFYLKYHGYSAFFPLWAVARYQAMLEQNDPDQPWGM